MGAAIITIVFIVAAAVGAAAVADGSDGQWVDDPTPEPFYTEEVVPAAPTAPAYPVNTVDQQYAPNRPLPKQELGAE